MEVITCNGEEYPVRFSKRALANFEKNAGVLISAIGEKTSIEHMMILAFEALKEGFRKSGKKFNLTLDKLYDLDDDYGLVDDVFDLFAKSEKKQD